MKTNKIICIALSLLFCLSALVGFTVPASAGDAIENIFEDKGYGVPNLTTAGGPTSTNINFISGGNIPVNTGDKIYMGPCVTAQTYQMMAYGASAIKLSATSAGVTKTDFSVATNLSILCYTVPAGITSVSPTPSQLLKNMILVTKNRSFTEEEYISYFEGKGVDVKSMIGGDKTPAADFINVFAQDGVFDGRADGTPGVATTLISDTRFYCTKGYIPVKHGDIVYFVGNTSQGHHLSLYTQNKINVSNINSRYMVQYEDLGNGYAIYAYRMREDVGFLRVTTSSQLYTSGVTLATLNQPFDEAGYREWCKLNNASPDAFIGSTDTVAADDIVSVYDNTKVHSGYTSATGVVQDANMVYTDPIPLNTGDKLYFGPFDGKMAIPAIAVCNSSSAVVGAFKTTELEKVTVFDSGLFTYCYTATADVKSVIINTEAKYSDYLLVTKNQKYDRFGYDKCYSESVPDGENLWNPASAIYGGYAHITSSLVVSDIYNCSAYISVKPGDVVYVATLHTAQPMLGSCYASDFTPVANLSIKHMKTEFMLSDNMGMLSYTVPAGVGYVRFIPRASLLDYMFITLNKAPTKAEFIEHFNIVLPTPDANSPLNGKSALFIGDSITFGACDTGTFWMSWPGRIGALTGLTVQNNGDSGARISRTGTSGFIDDNLLRASNVYDMIVVHGGVNDAGAKIDIGTITPEGTTSFNTNTFAGGLEQIFFYTTRLYSRADVFFVSNFRLDGNNSGYRKDMSPYFNIAKRICAKWNVQFIDLYGNTELNNKLDTTSKTYLPDLLHPNAEGYDVITPYIIEALEAFYAPEIPVDTTEQTDPQDTDPQDTEPKDTEPQDTVTEEPGKDTTEPTLQPTDTQSQTGNEPEEKSCGGVSACIALIAVVISGTVCVFTIKKH